MSVCPSFRTGNFGEYFSKICREINISLQCDKNDGYFTWRSKYFTFMLSRWILTNFGDKIKTHFVFKNIFFRNSFHLWDNVGKRGRARQATDDDIMRRWRFACWITKATNTHSIHVTFIGFPRRKWLGERASVLRYTCIVYWLWTHSFVNISGPLYQGFSTFLVQRTCHEDSRILQTPSPNYLNFQLAYCLATNCGNILNLEYLLIGNTF